MPSPLHLDTARPTREPSPHDATRARPLITGALIGAYLGFIALVLV